MSTIGNKAATQHVSLQKQTITGNGGTSYSLQQSVGSALDIAVFVNNTRQEPTVAYSASGTTLTMTGAVNASDNFYVIFLGKAITTTGLPVDTVGTANINANAVTAAKLHDDAVTHAKLPSGSSLQILQATTTAITDIGNSNTATILQQAITPSSTSSKVLVNVSANLGGDNNAYGYGKVFRDSTLIGAGAAASSRPQVSFSLMSALSANFDYRMAIHNFMFLDSPSTTSSTTYAVNVTCTSGNIRLNRTTQDGNDTLGVRSMSTLTLTEIAG